MVPTVEVLKLVQAYVNEDNYTVWNDLARNLANIALLLQYTDYYNEYKAFARKLFEKVVAKVGWNATKDESKLSISVFFFFSRSDIRFILVST